MFVCVPGLIVVTERVMWKRFCVKSMTNWVRYLFKNQQFWFCSAFAYCFGFFVIQSSFQYGLTCFLQYNIHSHIYFRIIIVIMLNLMRNFNWLYSILSLKFNFDSAVVSGAWQLVRTRWHYRKYRIERVFNNDIRIFNLPFNLQENQWRYSGNDYRAAHVYCSCKIRFLVFQKQSWYLIIYNSSI